ncbi:efflux RND transporter periplasmic adaptor subunit [Lonsdalea quercina]|uniref:efflux RND transporter periplasmic adaptor subunit n=1 Tax=Lonsdalea quercina TaxID=71657 RepID=UPI003974D619
MDIKRTIKKGRLKPFLIAGSALFVLIAGYLLISFDPGGFEVRASNILIGQVKQGDMVIEVQGNGILAPRNATWIASNIDGIVESVKVKPGAAVEPGDIIAVLVNPELIQTTEELRWELGAKEAENKALRGQQESAYLAAKIAIVKAEQEYRHAKLEYDVAEMLNKRNDGSVPLLVLHRSKLATEQTKQSLVYTKEQLEKLAIVQKENREADDARLSKLKNMLARAETQIRSLTVKASEAGIIQVTNIEVGQHITNGFSLARVARKDQLIAELKVPERQIRDVAIDQSVLINTHTNQIHGRVSRIDPAVINGTVQVDVEFTEPLPNEARPDLSIEGRVQVANLKNVIYAPRPMYAQSNTPGIVYKLAADGKSAVKVPVNFGMGSANEIAISSGLVATDHIILSSYQPWEHVDQISITR